MGTPHFPSAARMLAEAPTKVDLGSEKDVFSATNATESTTSHPKLNADGKDAGLDPLNQVGPLVWY